MTDLPVQREREGFRFHDRVQQRQQTGECVASRAEPLPGRACSWSLGRSWAGSGGLEYDEGQVGMALALRALSPFEKD